jgi:hypothetical protein
MDIVTIEATMITTTNYQNKRVSTIQNIPLLMVQQKIKIVFEGKGRVFE